MVFIGTTVLVGYFKLQRKLVGRMNILVLLQIL